MTTFKIEREKKGTNNGKEFKDKNILKQKRKEREKECEKTKKRIERRKDKKKIKMNNLKEGINRKQVEKEEIEEFNLVHKKPIKKRSLFFCKW